ncbi:hypothetical protein ACF0H5_000737 [Mactra antiquata]
MFTCDVCDTTYVRQSSLNRHKRQSCRGQLPFSRKISKRSSNVEINSTLRSHDVVSPAESRIINNLCRRMEEKKKNVLVLTVDDDSFQWFGSTLGEQFSLENPEFIDKFFLYCKGSESRKTNVDENSNKNLLKENNYPLKPAVVKIEKVTLGDYTIKSEFNTSEHIGTFNGQCNGELKDHDVETSAKEVTDHDDFDNHNDDSIHNIDDGDDDNSDMLADGDSDDDIVDDDDNDDVGFSRDAKDSDERKMEDDRLERYTDREKCFNDIAEEFMQTEGSRMVDHILRKKCIPIKSFFYTVPDLNRGKYTCRKCGYKFIWKLHLETHQVKVPNCQEIRIFSSESQVLEMNITFVHSDLKVEITTKLNDLLLSQRIPLKCAVCGTDESFTRDQLTKHLIQHFGEAFVCNICGAGFYEVKSLSGHLREHFKKPYECSTCSWNFPTSAMLTLHTRLDICLDTTGENTVTIKSENEIKDSMFECTNCSEKIKGHGEMRKHMSDKHNISKDPLECVLCYKKFSFPELYYTHVTCHSPKRYHCPFCKKTYPNRNKLYQAHVQWHCDESDRYMCEMCGEKFKYKRYYDVHKRRHTGERPYICEVEGCGKDFRSPDGLKQHKWVHENRFFLCNYCGRKFKQPSLLNNHKKTHTEEWRYTCIYCPEKFHTLWRFKKHLAHTHPDKVTDIKEKFKITLHRCEMCPKVYYESEDYRCHLNTHKGIKPYPCTVCGKSFTDKSNMKAHEKTHSGGKKLKCELCPRRFDEEKYLKAHVERLHSNTVINISNNIEQTVTEMYAIVRQPIKNIKMESTLVPYQEDVDELRERTLQIIDETIREEVKF